MKGKKTQCDHLTRKMGLLIVDGVAGMNTAHMNSGSVQADLKKRPAIIGRAFAYIYGGIE